MSRVYNFSAGPACLPEWVLKKASEEMLDAHGSGMSVMEMSHRSKAFEDILHTCKDRLRRLMNIPEDYEILFIQGGGSMQFIMTAINLLKQSADIINTGRHIAARGVRYVENHCLTSLDPTSPPRRNR